MIDGSANRLAISFDPVPKLIKAGHTKQNYLHESMRKTADEYLCMPSVNSTLHTMAGSIDRFCTNRVPLGIFRNTLAKGVRIEALGVYPSLFEMNHAFLGYAAIKHIPFAYLDPAKRYSYVRPQYYEAVDCRGDTVLVAAITPGRDYVRHYVSMFRHIIAGLGHDAQQCLAVTEYPRLGSGLVDWTELDKQFVKAGDIVVLGFVDAVRRHLLASALPLEPLGWRENEYYGSMRYRLPDGTVLTFLGAKFSFWGDLSAKVVERVLALGAQELLYVAKLGTLTAPSDLYNRVFSPTAYRRNAAGQLTAPLLNVGNPLVQRFPKLNSGAHCSVATILEENYRLRTLLTEHCVATVDNEISYMAEVVAFFNEQTGKNVPFAAAHFATDYLRRADQANLLVEHDLSNNREAAARQKKKAILSNVGHIVGQYLLGRPATYPHIKATVIGTGFGKRTILPALRDLGVNIVALSGGADENKTRTIAAEYGIGCFGPSFDRTSDKRSDVLFIAAPHEYHHKMVLGALARDVHIVCEKPLALSKKEMRDVVRVSEPSSRLHLVNHELRFFPLFQEIKRLLEGEVIGAERSVSIKYNTNRLAKAKNWCWWFDDAKGGGMLLAMGTHFIDLLQYWFDTDVREVVSASMGNRVGDLLDAQQAMHSNHAESWFNAVARMRNGVEVTISCDGTAKQNDFEIVIAGSHGQIHYREPAEAHVYRVDDHGFLIDKQPVLDGFVMPPEKSVWRLSFDYFAAEVMKAVASERCQDLKARATTFADYARQFETIQSIRRAARDASLTGTSPADIHPSLSQRNDTLGLQR